MKERRGLSARDRLSALSGYIFLDYFYYGCS